MKVAEIKNPKFISNLSAIELKTLAEDIRHAIIEVVSEHGGHLSSNLGVVELTIALHKEFDFLKDRLLIDVGHQSYTHKILTGRYQAMKDGLRELNGIAGYQKINESPYDHFEAGHAGTALSAAVGMKIAHPDDHVVALVGDSSMANGLSMEALNHLGHLPNKVIIVYNDNGMGISTPVGGTYRFFSKARSSRSYQNSKYYIRKFLLAHWLTKPMYYVFHAVKEFWRRLTIGSNLFENMGLFYLGPVDGHDIRSLCNSFEVAKMLNKSVVIHVMTEKGHGYQPALKDPNGYWHGVEPFNPMTGATLAVNDSSALSWSAVLAKEIHQLMGKDERIQLITPAMATGSKLEKLFTDYETRCFDVGIAEGHAVTMATGMAAAHLKPIVAIYSTFLQRAYDQVIHDAARINVPVTYIVDRAGIVGNDGETHQGIFDAAFLRLIPNCTIAMPKDEVDARNLLTHALDQSSGSFFIRIPRGKIRLGDFRDTANCIEGRWSFYPCQTSVGTIVVTGPLVHEIVKMRDQYQWPLTVVFARYYHPMDEEAIKQIASLNLPIMIVDRYSTKDALVEPLVNRLRDILPSIKTTSIALPTAFIAQGNLDEVYQEIGLDIAQITQHIKDFFKL